MKTTEATTTEATTSDFINKYFTASTVAIDETKSLSLYKLKDYNTSYTIGLSNLTVYIETSSSEVVQYLKTRLEAAKASNSQTALQNWQAYNKPLQQLALEEYKKVFASFDIKKQFEVSCCGQVVLISPTDNEGMTLRKNIFMRPALPASKVNKDNKKITQTSLNKHLDALQNALLSDSNAKIKKQVENLLDLWEYDLSFMAIDAEGIHLLKNLGCLSGAKGNRHSQSKATLLNKVVECVYTRRKRINANNADSTDKNNADNNTDK